MLAVLLLSIGASADAPFGAEQVISSSSSSPRSVFAADVDSDGDLDTLAASQFDDTVAWYENIDGAGGFGSAQIITTLADGVTWVVAADVDGDGDVDALAASSLDNTIAWFENTDGAGTFGPEQVIDALANSAQSVLVADIDGDGDLDALSVAFGTDTVAWYENTDGAGTFGAAQAITTTADGAVAIDIADFDRDGDPDVVVASQNDDTVAWFANTGGVFGAAQTLTTTADGARAVHAADLDRDGDLDIVATSTADNTVAWYENTNGAGSFGIAQVIDTAAGGPGSVVTSDLDADGDLDVLTASASTDTIAWYENTDGSGSFATARVITNTADFAFAVFAADIDGDGDTDALSASALDNTVAWYPNEWIHGRASLEERRSVIPAVDGAESVFAADMDGDGDLDVLSASFDDDTIAWYENTDASGSLGPAQPITTSAAGAESVFAADLDGDGDPDVLSASFDDDTIAWYENTDGGGSFGSVQAIGTTADGAESVSAADVDGDGDLDVIAASSNDGTFAWYENTDGHGSFGSEQAITTSATGARAVFPADLDADGDFDLLTGWGTNATFAWYENTNGLGSFGLAQTLSSTVASHDAWAAFAADLDGDGDLDALSGSSEALAWYENTDGQGSFGPLQTIDGAGVFRSVFAADADGDGDLDVLATKFFDDEIVWYENTDGQGSFGAGQTISTGVDADGPESVFAADLDGDGDLDALAAASTDDTIIAFENTDGQGNFGAKQTISTNIIDPHSLFAADLDGDGDVDALSGSRHAVDWHENTDGSGTFGPGQVIETSVPHEIFSVGAADVDGDGDLDALVASFFGDTVAWYENTDGLGSFGSAQLIAIANGPLSVVASDVDGDGDLDVLLTTGFEAVFWYENTDGQGSFGPAQAISVETSADSIFAADVDADGDPDVFASFDSQDKIAWYENTDGLGSFGVEQIVTSTVDGPNSVFAADVDGDGDLDALSASRFDDTIAWYENTDGQGSFGGAQTITTTANAASAVLAADLDGDGDPDVLSGPAVDPVAWYENTDGLGSFGPEQVLTTQGTQSIVAADVDRDGDLDALSDLPVDDTIVWHENLPWQVSTTTAPLAPAVAFPTEQIGLLHVQLTHFGRPGDGDAELGTLVLGFDRAPATPLTSDPVGPLTSAEANALVENLFVYRDEGSGQFEPGSDTLVATVASLSLDNGMLAVALTDGDPDAAVSTGGSGLFFAAAELTATSASADPSAFRVRHLSGVSEIQHADSNLVVSNDAGGTQPRVTTVLVAAADDDSDGLSNSDERDLYGTNPLDADSDDDALTDGDEVNVHGTDPLLSDTDGDGLSDEVEINTHGTNPLLPDTDADGLDDSDELAAGTNPLLPDTDGDGLSDGDEVNLHGTDPLLDDDNDGDTISDADEVSRGMHPLIADTDADGFADAVDNCPSAYNPDQLDQAGFGTGLPDGIGDLCQNGDFNRDGVVDILDVTLERRGLIGLEPTLDPALPPSTP